MEEQVFTINNTPVRVYALSALAAGSGATGFNAADTLYDEGLRDIALVTEDLRGGTSRNAGSDKQTYYKLSLAGSEGDSVRALAETLFTGQCMDGDIALCEAAASVPCFMKLVRLGIPFPKNQYGEYVGYKTDHDPARRATSAGPYTSKLMTEALEAQVKAKGIRIFDKMMILRVLTDQGRAAGLLCLDLDAQEDPLRRFVVFWTPNIIWAAGGPGDLYETSVYPESQHGAGGAAFEAGCLGRNLTEWQYGLASIRPRWNVSGTYMQVLPRFVSTDPSGGDEREFLLDHFSGLPELLSLVFLKGYQWPFDVRKLNGSSIIDLLVYAELRKGRRVFLDYRYNPQKKASVDFTALSTEAHDYLAASGACFGVPMDRLEKMNKPALDFFHGKGVDLKTEMLEIALCAQHNNGGLAVDCRWQSNIAGFFPVGEAAATHGVYRPGGSALNAGQTGSYRAACFIAHKRPLLPFDSQTMERVFRAQLPDLISLPDKVTGNGRDNVPALIREARERMSRAGAVLRAGEDIAAALKASKELWDAIGEKAGIRRAGDLSQVYRLRDILFCQYIYLSAMDDYIRHNGKSRGGAVYRSESGQKLHDALPEFRYVPDDGRREPEIQELVYKDGACICTRRQARPIPAQDDSFETIWNDFRRHGNIL
ncbi:MAG: FAD-binding protein [Treponema sp.]|jgi:succinate dehydrogenase/fumarate reductase flavoprotein subunit|nr:FAD-binding protein [Treponema sp.]